MNDAVLGHLQTTIHEIRLSFDLISFNNPRCRILLLADQENSLVPIVIKESYPFRYSSNFLSWNERIELRCCQGWSFVVEFISDLDHDELILTTGKILIHGSSFSGKYRLFNPTLDSYEGVVDLSLEFLPNYESFTCLLTELEPDSMKSAQLFQKVASSINNLENSISIFNIQDYSSLTRLLHYLSPYFTSDSTLNTFEKFFSLIQKEFSSDSQTPAISPLLQTRQFSPLSSPISKSSSSLSPSHSSQFTPSPPSSPAPTKRMNSSLPPTLMASTTSSPSEEEPLIPCTGSTETEMGTGTRTRIGKREETERVIRIFLSPFQDIFKDISPPFISSSLISTQLSLFLSHLSLSSSTPSISSPPSSPSVPPPPLSLPLSSHSPLLLSHDQLSFFLQTSSLWFLHHLLSLLRHLSLDSSSPLRHHHHHHLSQKKQQQNHHQQQSSQLQIQLQSKEQIQSQQLNKQQQKNEQQQDNEQQQLTLSLEQQIEEQEEQVQVQEESSSLSSFTLDRSLRIKLDVNLSSDLSAQSLPLLLQSLCTSPCTYSPSELSLVLSLLDCEEIGIFSLTQFLHWWTQPEEEEEESN